MSTSTPPDPGVIAPRPGEELDPALVGSFLADKVPNPGGTPEVWQFPGGHANLTYLIRYADGQEYVLRRPPHGDIPKGAHDMAREYRVLSSLWRAFPQAPRAYAFSDDLAILGAKFFVMERRHGLVVRRDVPAAFGGGDDPAANRQLSEVLIDTLAAFHRVDPAAADLADIGKAEGFLARQVKGWTDRWVRAKTEDVPSADRVIAWLQSEMPASPPGTLVHNDWRLDNMAVATDDPSRCVAVYDWDMCTIGDPLTDLGTLLASWNEEGEPFEFLSPMPSRAPGFMKRREAIERYGRVSGIDVRRIGYYYVFGLFKMAVVVQQLFYRWHLGQTKDARMAGGAMVAKAMLDLALEETSRAE